MFQGLSYLLTGGGGFEDSLTCSTPLQSARAETQGAENLSHKLLRTY